MTTLPFNDKQKVFINPNEAVTDVTLNITTSRLLINDRHLLSYTQNIEATSGVNGIDVNINATDASASIISANISTLSALLQPYLPVSGVKNIQDCEDYAGTAVHGNLLTYDTGKWTAANVNVTNAAHTLESHSNVTTPMTPENGDSLVYDSSLLKFTNKKVGGEYKTTLKFISLTGYLSGNGVSEDDVNLGQMVTAPLTYQTHSCVYDLQSFVSPDVADLSANYDKIRSVFVEVDMSATTTNQFSSINFNLDGTYYPVIYDNMNNDKSSMVTKFVSQIPIDYKSNVMDISIENQTSGTQFKVIGAFYEEVERIYPDIDFILVQGQTASLSGFIGYDTTSVANYNIWSNVLNSEQPITDYKKIFPIGINQDTTKTEIEIHNYSAAQYNNNSEGHIVVDWNENKVHGYLNENLNGEFVSYIISGAVNAELTGVLMNSANNAHLNVAPIFSTGNYTITKLPKIDSTSASFACRDFNYSIKNFKTIFIPPTSGI